MLIDTHAHIFYKDYHGKMDDILARAESAGVGQIICVGLDIKTSQQAIALAEEHANIWATVGVHPHDAEGAPADYIDQLRELADHPRVVAIGEMGLDYFRNYSPHELQRQQLRAQLELAAELDKPAVIHNRAADDDMLKILTEVGHGKGVMHCFSSSAHVARQVIELGLHLSFTGTVTYGKNDNAHVLKTMGLERVMVETDCPYLAPVPTRGKTNEPSFVVHTAERIAEICGATLDEVAAITTANAQRLFGIG